MFITDSELLGVVADHLKVATPDDLPAHWRNIAARANLGAYQTIVGELLARGFDKVAQVDLWDRGAEYQRAIGSFLALLDGGAYAGYDKETLKGMDRRPELRTVLVFVLGAWVRPAEGNPGLVTSGGPVQQDSVFGDYKRPGEPTSEVIDW